MSPYPKYLEDFVKEHEDKIGSSGLASEEFTKVWKDTFRIMKDSSCNYQALCLKTIRILSREKKNFELSLEDEHIHYIIGLAGLSQNTKVQAEHRSNDEDNYDVLFEAQKCLSNMLYQSQSVQNICSSPEFLSILLDRVSEWRNMGFTAIIRAFDVKILFLVTALRRDVSARLKGGSKCVASLVEILRESLSGTTRDQNHDRLHSAENASLVVDVLKTLYNIATSFERGNPKVEDLRSARSLVQVVREMLLTKGPSEKHTLDIQCHCSNLLLLMPPLSYEELVPSKDPQVESSNSTISDRVKIETEFLGKDVSSIVLLLNFLHLRLQNASVIENLLPVLTLFVEMAQNCRIIRKFVRSKILPPLRDASKRPEEGNSIKSKLCCHMTSSHSQLSYLSSHLLFILCKEKVSRLVKHTGYGNAAGLLASRGLMLSFEQPAEGDYSTDSESSDTEEYNHIKDQVNPVTGCMDTPKASPLEGMTEEQKEREAMKLVAAIDKLTRGSAIRPCRIGPDGKPQLVEHVLQLQNDILGSNDKASNDDSINSDS